MSGGNMNKTNYFQLSFRHTKYASYLGYITQAIVNNLSPLLFIVFQNNFGISLEKIGILISLNFGVQIITDLIAAKYVDRIGYRAASVLAHILSTIGLISLGILPGIMPNAYSGLIIAMVINAIGGGLIEVLISPIVEALPGDEKESAMSMLHSFYCWGHVSVVILSTVYFNTIGLDHWEYLPVLWAVVPFFNTFLFAKVPINTLVEAGEGIPLHKLFKVKVFWILFILMICAGASEQAMSQWASLFAEVGLKVSKNVGDLLGPCAFAVLMGISRTIYGIKGSKMNLMRTIVASSVLCVISYLIAVFSPIPIIALMGCAVCGFSVGIMWPGVFSISAKKYPQGGTGMFAMLALAGDIGCSSGPGIVGWVANVFGNLKKGLLIAILFPLLLMFCILVLNKYKGEKI